MSDILGNIFSAIIASIMFILCVFTLIIRFDGLTDTKIQDDTSSFVDMCRTTGKIEPENYETFCNTIYMMGDYDIEICHGKKLAYADGDKTRIGFKESYTEEITNYMYGDGSKEYEAYPMKTGDTIRVNVKRHSGGMSNILIGLFLGQKINGQTIINYSGTVGSNG